MGFGDEVSLQTINEARSKGLDIAEMRIDRYKSYGLEHVLNEISRFSGFSTLATIRLAAEGGSWNLSEDERLNIFRKIIPEVDAIDIEFSSETILSEVIKEAHSHHKVVIVSYHNFDRTPSLKDLNEIVVRAVVPGVEIIEHECRIGLIKHERDLLSGNKQTPARIKI